MGKYLSYATAINNGGEEAATAQEGRSAANRASALEDFSKIMEARKPKKEAGALTALSNWMSSNIKPNEPDPETQFYESASGKGAQKALEAVASGAENAQNQAVVQDIMKQRELAALQAKDNEKAESIMRRRFVFPPAKSITNVEAVKAFMVGQATDILGERYATAKEYALAGKEMPDWLKRDVSELEGVSKYKSSDTGFATWVNSAAKFVGQQAATVADPKHNPYVTGAVAGTMAAGAAAVSGGAAAVPSGAAAAAATQAAVMNRSARHEGGFMFKEFLSLKHADGKKVSNKEAAVLSDIGGAINGVLETAGWSQIAKVIPGLSSFASKAALSNPAVKTALLGWAKKYASGVGTEMFTEGMQELPEIIGSAILQDKSVSKALMNPENQQQILDVMAETAKGVALIGAPGTIKSAHRDIKEIRAEKRAINENMAKPDIPELPVAEPVKTPEKAPEKAKVETSPDKVSEVPPKEKEIVKEPLLKVTPTAEKSTVKETILSVPETKTQPAVETPLDASSAPGAVAKKEDGSLTTPILAPEGFTPRIKLELFHEEPDHHETQEAADGTRQAMPARTWKVVDPRPIKLGWLSRPAVMMNDGTIYEGPQVNPPSITRPIIQDLDALVASRRKAEQRAINAGYRLEDTEEGPTDVKNDGEGNGFVITGPAGTQAAGQIVFLSSNMVNEKFKGEHGSLEERIRAKMGDNYENAIKAKQVKETEKAESKNQPVTPEEVALLKQPYVQKYINRVVSGLATGGRDKNELRSIATEKSVDAARTALAKTQTPEGQKKAFFTALRGATQNAYEQSFGTSRRGRAAQRKAGTTPVSLEAAGIESVAQSPEVTESSVHEKENAVVTRVSSQTPIKQAQAKAEVQRAGEKKPPIRTKVYTKEEIAAENAKRGVVSKAQPTEKRSKEYVPTTKRETDTMFPPGVATSKTINEYRMNDKLYVRPENNDTSFAKFATAEKKAKEIGGTVLPTERGTYVVAMEPRRRVEHTRSAVVEGEKLTVVEPKFAKKENKLSVQESKAELNPVYDLIDKPEFKKKRVVRIKEHNLNPGEPANIHPTWHDGAYRFTAMKSPSGELMEGRGGSYDTILSEGHVAGAKRGPLPEGSTLYVIDSGPYTNLSVDIYRTSESVKSIPGGGSQKLIENPIVAEEPAKVPETIRSEGVSAVKENDNLNENPISTVSPLLKATKRLAKLETSFADKPPTVVEKATIPTESMSHGSLGDEATAETPSTYEATIYNPETKNVVGRVHSTKDGMAGINEVAKASQEIAKNFNGPTHIVMTMSADGEVSTDHEIAKIIDHKYNPLANQKGEDNFLTPGLAGGAMQIFGGLKRQMQKAGKLLDVEYQWKKLGLDEIGFTIKNYFSRRDVEERRGMEEAIAVQKLITESFGGKPTRQNLLDIVLAAETPEYLTIPGENTDKIRPAALRLRKYFDDSQKEFADRGLNLDFKQNQIARLKEKLVEIKDAETQSQMESIIAEMEETDEKFQEKKIAKLKERAEKTRAKLSAVEKSEFVHIPYRMIFQKKLRAFVGEADPVVRKKRHAEMRSLLAAKRHANTIAELLQKKDKEGNYVIDVDELNPVNIIMNYAYNKGQDHALLDIRDAITTYDKTFKISKKKPSDTKEGYGWIKITQPKLTILKTILNSDPDGKNKFVWIRTDVMQALNDALGYQERQNKYDKYMSIAKMTAFWNPFFLPFYNTLQSIRGGVINPMHPLRTAKAWSKARQDVGGYKTIFSNQSTGISEDYLEALRNGLASKPFSNPFEGWRSFADSINTGKGGSWATDFIRGFKSEFEHANPMAKYTLVTPVLKSMYNASWHMAWQMDELFRMQSYNYLREKGHSPREAAQVSANLQGDYAGVPPRTRKWLNRFFFTPTFKIATMKLYNRLLRDAMKVGYEMISHPTQYKKNTTKSQRRYARAAFGVIAVNMIFHMVMTRGLGFEEDSWSSIGRRYRKRIQTDRGPKDFYITFATSENIIQRYMERIQKAFWEPGVTNPFTTFIKSNQWEIHPVYRNAYAAITGQGDEGSVWSGADSNLTKTRKSLWYFTNKTINVLDAVQSRTEFSANKLERERVSKQWVREYGKGFGTVLNGLETIFGYGYIAETKKNQEVMKLKAIKSQFIKEAYESIRKQGSLNPTLTSNYKAKMKEVMNSYKGRGSK